MQIRTRFYRVDVAFKYQTCPKTEGRTIVMCYEKSCIHRFCVVNRKRHSSISYLYFVIIFLRRGEERIRKILWYEGESVLREYFPREVIRTRN